MFQITFHHDFYQTLRSLPPGHFLFEEMARCLTTLAKGYWSDSGFRVAPVEKRNRPGRSAKLNLFAVLVTGETYLLFARLPWDRLVIFDAAQNNGVNLPLLALHNNTEREATEVGDFTFHVSERGAPILDGESLPELPRDAFDYVSVSESGSSTIYTVPFSAFSNANALETRCRETRTPTEFLLSAEQEAALYYPYPAFISGKAGTGKTTLLTHKLHRLKAENPDATILYVDSSPVLVANAKKACKDLQRSAGISESTDKIRFLSLHELCWEIYHSSAETTPRHHTELFGARDFESWWRKQRSKPKGLTATDAWREIQTVLKGQVQDIESPLLTQEEYSALPTAPNSLPEKLREGVYKAAVSYQNFLSENQRFDPADLARHTLRSLADLTSEKRQLWEFDGVFCDNIQNFTLLELRIIQEIAANLRHLSPNRPSLGANLWIAGNPQPGLYPSASGWGSILSRLNQKSEKPIETIYLTQNLRSPRPLRQLADTIQHSFEKSLRESFPPSSEPGFDFTTLCRQFTSGGLPPVTICAAEKEMLTSLRLLPHNTGRVILTRDRETAEQLRGLLETETAGTTTHPAIYAIEDFEGQEADCVILWRYFKESGDFGAKKATRNQTLSRLMLLSEWNHLFIAVSSSRTRFFSLDAISDPSPWHLQDDFKAIPFQAQTPQWLIENQNADMPPEEWWAKAQSFEQRGQENEAALCYRAAGRLWYDQGNWDRASEALRLSKAEDCAELLTRSDAERYERENRFDEGLILWKEIGDLARAARIHERFGDWKAAAAYWDTTPAESQNILFHLRWLTTSVRRFGGELVGTVPGNPPR